jgi:hypothetical protein
MAIDLRLDRALVTDKAATPWAAVTCLSLLTFLLVGLEFMPVSLLTPIARDLAPGKARSKIGRPVLYGCTRCLEFGGSSGSKPPRLPCRDSSRLQSGGMKHLDGQDHPRRA